MSDSVRPHRRQPTRLLRPWDSPGKNTGMGCHFLLQCMKVKKLKLLSRVQLLATSWTAAYQAPPSMGFSRQEYWSEVPLPSPMYMLSCVQLFVTLESSSPGFSLHESIPGKNTGVGCMPSSRGSSQPRDRTQVSCIVGRFFTV